MARDKISYVDASKALTENQNRREQSRLESVQKAIDEREKMRGVIENARDARFHKDRNHSMMMEAARDDNLSKALKAIYITALNPNSLTEMNLAYADGIVDNYVNERGGATNILNGVKNHTYFLSRLTQIVEDAAKIDVHDIENMDRDLEKDLEVTGSEPIPEKDNDVHDMEPESKTDDDKGSKEGTEHKPFDDTPYKDFQPAGKDENIQSSNETVENSLDVELFDESFLLEDGDEKEESNKSDDDSNIDVKSNGGNVTIKIDNSDKSESEKEKDDEKKEESSEDKTKDSSTDENIEVDMDDEGTETEIKDTDASEESKDDESEKTTDSKNEEKVDSETEEEVENTEAPEDDDIDLNDIDGDGEDDDDDDEDIESVDTDEETDSEVDDDESAEDDDDVNNIVGDDIDGSDQDSDDSIDGNEDHGKLFNDLENEPDVKKAIEIIRDRISDAEETFIKNNAKDKAEISKLVDKISNNVKTVEDAGKDSKEGKIAQESAQCLDRYRKDIQQGRPVMSIFEKITRKINGSMLKNRQVLESYLDEDTGKLDEALIIESARVLYGWLETVNTLQLEKVNEEFIENVIAQIK